MSSREEPEIWRPEAKPASASGGHIAPETQTGPLYDPLNAPLPSEREPGGWRPEPAQPAPRAEPPYAPERTDVIPRPLEERPIPRRSEAPRRRPSVRRVKRTVRHVDPGSVLKISLFFYAIFLVLWLIAVAIGFWFVENAGWFKAIEDFQEGFAFTKSEITLMTVERWAFLIGLTFVVVGSILNVFLSFLYNVAADLMGGVELTFVERETPP